jgi:hypothetical protein
MFNNHGGIEGQPKITFSCYVKKYVFLPFQKKEYLKIWMFLGTRDYFGLKFSSIGQNSQTLQTQLDTKKYRQMTYQVWYRSTDS